MEDNELPTSHTTGTVEYWCMKSSDNAGGDGLQGAWIQLWNDTTQAITVSLGYFTWYKIYADGPMGAQDIQTGISYDRWYHIRIDFDCVSNRFDCYVDGIYRGNFLFKNNVSSISKILVLTDSLYEGVTYFDAIGYSWDPNYNIGDNLNEGLLLSFENDTSLDWMGYPLDGQANRTILGNATIPLPSNGPHNIQLFGNDSLGTMYHSEVVHFCVKEYLTMQIIVAGAYLFQTDPEGTTDYKVNISIGIDGVTELLYAGFRDNPLSTPLSNGLLFVEILLNDTDNLSGMLNITFIYQGATSLSNLKCWWFNESANGGIGEWQEVAISVDGNEITISIDHASIFALSGIEEPLPPPNGGGDDGGDGGGDGGGGGDDDDKAETPTNIFENSLLLIVILGIVGGVGITGALVYIKARKKK